jgi:uncharacterized HAD superfamily protein
MNLGFDLDEVIAQTAGMAVEYLNYKFDCKFGIEVFRNFKFEKNLYSGDFEKQRLAVEALTHAVTDKELMSTIKPYKEAIKVLNTLKRSGHKIFIITKREKALTGMTNSWLHKYNISFDKLVLTNTESKSSLAKQLKLDFFIDDLEDNLYEMYKAKARWKKGLVLMTRPWNENDYIDTSKFIRIEKWDEVLKIVSQGNRLKG